MRGVNLFIRGSVEEIKAGGGERGGVSNGMEILRVKKRGEKMGMEVGMGGAQRLS